MWSTILGALMLAAVSAAATDKVDLFVPSARFPCFRQPTITAVRTSLASSTIGSSRRYHSTTHLHPFPTSLRAGPVFPSAPADTWLPHAPRYRKAGADRMTLLAFAENRNVSACAPALDGTATAVGVCAHALIPSGRPVVLAWRLMLLGGRLD